MRMPLQLATGYAATAMLIGASYAQDCTRPSIRMELTQRPVSVSFALLSAHPNYQREFYEVKVKVREPNSTWEAKFSTEVPFAVQGVSDKPIRITYSAQGNPLEARVAHGGRDRDSIGSSSRSLNGSDLRFENYASMLLCDPERPTEVRFGETTYGMVAQYDRAMHLLRSAREIREGQARDRIDERNEQIEMRRQRREEKNK